MHNELHILLLRHGQTDDNAAGVLQGHKPTPLNALGQQQAMNLAARLSAWNPKIDAVVSSDLPRALQSAAPIAAACGARLVLDPLWRERGLGELEGRPIGEHATWRAASGEINPPGAEAMDAFQHRIHHALTTLRDRFAPAGVLAVVTHGGPCRTVLRMLTDGRLPPLDHQPAPPVVPIINCSIMHLVETGGLWTLRCLNDAAHLDMVAATSRDAG